MDILGKRKIWYSFSLTLLIIGLIFFFTTGLNLGIDFDGGTVIYFGFEEEVETDQIRQILEDINIAPEASIRQVDEDGQPGIMIRSRQLETEEISRMVAAVEDNIPGAELFSEETVGPVIGQQLRRNAFWALLIASIAILIYISIRFEFRFAVVAIITLLHDVIITVGLFTIIGHEVNTPFIAALLTILGYSLNDTIVIFDRIRENMTLMRRTPFIDLANKAVVDTLPRSINTSITTLVTVLAIYLFGGAALQTFMLALLIGLAAGSYSSIFIASPLLVTWNNKFAQTASSK